MEYKEPYQKDGRRVNSGTLEELIRILEQAGFSNEEISLEQYTLAKDRVDELFTGVQKKPNDQT